MRRLPVIVASFLFSLACSAGADTTPPKKPVNSRKLGLTIKVEGGGWGNVQKESIETVLYAVADELLSHLPQNLVAPIVVTHTDSNPVALYERSAKGEYQVHLHASEQNWHLYTYEFAHELCHLLSNYESNSGPDRRKYNQWFEETLCETASLFTLKNLATTWATAPPAPEWAGAADKLSRFFDLLIAEGHRRLPPDAALPAWLSDNEQQLRHDPYLRKQNELVANLLLPLFERDRENWSSLNYLNLDPGDARSSFHDYLRHWHQNAPPEHQPFIADVLALFRQQAALPQIAEAPGPPEDTARQPKLAALDIANPALPPQAPAKGKEP